MSLFGKYTAWHEHAASSFSSVSQLLGAKSLIISFIINFVVFAQAVLEAMESHPKESDIQIAGR